MSSTLFTLGSKPMNLAKEITVIKKPTTDSKKANKRKMFSYLMLCNISEVSKVVIHIKFICK